MKSRSLIQIIVLAVVFCCFIFPFTSAYASETATIGTKYATIRIPKSWSYTSDQNEILAYLSELYPESSFSDSEQVFFAIDDSISFFFSISSKEYNSNTFEDFVCTSSQVTSLCSQLQEAYLKNSSPVSVQSGYKLRSDRVLLRFEIESVTQDKQIFYVVPLMKDDGCYLVSLMFQLLDHSYETISFIDDFVLNNVFYPGSLIKLVSDEEYKETAVQSQSSTSLIFSLAAIIVYCLLLFLFLRSKKPFFIGIGCLILFATINGVFQMLFRYFSPPFSSPMESGIFSGLITVFFFGLSFYLCKKLYHHLFDKNANKIS